MFAKKNLIAVAALATLAVSAQAQSSVTLYGNLDVAVASLQSLNIALDPATGELTGSKDRATHVASSGLTESFFGLKGQEDLGGGLKAVFKLEGYVNVDTGSASSDFWGKNSFVGVSGGFGTLTLGNHETLFKTEGGAFNAFGNSAVVSPTVRLGLTNGFLSNILAVAADADASVFGTGGSWKNSVAYTSPNLNGLTLSAQYSAKEGANYGGAYAVAANYSAGPLALSAVYGQQKDVAEVYDIESATLPLPTVDAELKNRAFLLGASYDFGVAKAFAQYGQQKWTQEGASGSIKPKFYQIGAIFPVTTAGSVHAAIGQNKTDLGGEDLKTTDISLGYHHALSKRTSVYAAYINEKVKIAGESESTNSYAVGLRHAF